MTIISCLPVRYREKRVKIFFDLTLVPPVKIPIFKFLLPRLICAYFTTGWKYDVIYITFLALVVAMQKGYATGNNGKRTKLDFDKASPRKT